MESISIMDGLILTIVSMIVVFATLASIWGLIELVARYLIKDEELVDKSTDLQKSTPLSSEPNKEMTAKPEHQKIAELLALILASEDESDKKFEIIESKRIK